MSTEANKLKLLHLLRIFQEETDEDHGLSLLQIQELLMQRGISAERKALYRDFDRLREFGLDLEKRTYTSPTTYGLSSREFSAAELMLMADAVQSSKFLTKRKSDVLLYKIKGLGSKAQAGDLSKRLHVEGRIKMQNESVYANLDIIQAAIKKKRKICFKYFKHNVNKERVLQRDGGDYVVTPVHLIFCDGAYYCVVYSDKHENFTNYRVDRMDRLRVSDELATRNDAIAYFDVADYEGRSFGMFSGEPVKATLVVSESVMSNVIDRFGTDVLVTPGPDKQHAKVHVAVMETPTFYGWLSQFGSDMVIEKPKSLQKKYVSFLRGILDEY